MNFKSIFGIVEIILGAYLLNSFFKWVVIPASISVIDRWITLISSIIIIIVGLLTVFKKTSVLSPGF